jgi:hypothetical protein
MALPEQGVEQMTWSPGDDNLIRDKLTVEGGWLSCSDATVFNLYQPPQRALGDPAKAGPWINRLEHVYPDNADHIACFIAHRVQMPHERSATPCCSAGPRDRQGLAARRLAGGGRPAQFRRRHAEANIRRPVQRLFAKRSVED